jgi:drug/metabolite transporter (DMT)-like permease
MRYTNNKFFVAVVAVIALPLPLLLLMRERTPPMIRKWLGLLLLKTMMIFPLPLFLAALLNQDHSSNSNSSKERVLRR